MRRIGVTMRAEAEATREEEVETGELESQENAEDQQHERSSGNTVGGIAGRCGGFAWRRTADLFGDQRPSERGQWCLVLGR